MNTQLNSVVRQVRHLVCTDKTNSTPDGQLLERFTEARDEAAFEEIVTRYASLVTGLCFRVLQNRHEAEDAAQATFLALARKAASIRKKASLGAWLYGVAYRIARSAKMAAIKRHSRETNSRAARPNDPLAELTARELCDALDHELAALPEKHQTPLILCYLEAKTGDEAARQLGWSLATFKRRLEKARELLRLRLSRRGVALSAALLTVALATQSSAAVIAPAWFQATVGGAAAFAVGKHATGLIAARVFGLAETALKTTWTAKMCNAAAIVIGIAALGAGIGLFAPAQSSGSHDELKNADCIVAPAIAATAKPAHEPVAADGDPEPAKGPVKCIGHESFVTSVSLSPDGKHAASGSDDRTLRFWSARDGKQLWKSGPDAAAGAWVGGVRFTPDGKMLAAFVAGALRFFDAESGKDISDRFGITTKGYHLAVSADGKLLAVARQEDIKVWDLTTRKTIYRVRLGEDIGRAWRVAFSPDSTRLAAALHGAGGEEREGITRVRVWDLTDENPIFADWVQNSASDVAFSPDGKLLAAGGTLATGAPDDGAIVIWDLVAKKQLRRLHADKHVVFCLAFARDGKTLFSGGNDPAIKIWDVAGGKLIGQLEGHTDQVADLAISRDGKTLASAGRDKQVLIWNIAALPKPPPLDVRKLERPMAKSPAFRNKPKACLLVFGPEAKTRVWMVLDGDVLYIDRNGNGDLTEPEDRVVLQRAERLENCFVANVGEVTEADGTKHSLTRIVVHPGDLVTMTLETKTPTGDRCQWICWDGGDGVQFLPRADDAPLIHFDGPLTMDIPDLPELIPGRPFTLLAQVGSVGVGKGSFAALAFRKAPAIGVPIADIEFSHKKSGMPPIRRRVRLAWNLDFPTRFDASVTVPDDAAFGKAKITLSFADWKEGKVAPATIEVPFEDPVVKSARLFDLALSKGPFHASYVNKPTYCLLMIGPETKTRVWMALDGHVLYVDRNANGRIDAGERIVRSAAERTANAPFVVGDITDSDGVKHTHLQVHPGHGQISLFIDGKRRFDVDDNAPGGPLQFADDPAVAPIVHFDGPLTLAPVRNLSKLVRGAKGLLHVGLGANGRGKGAFSYTAASNLGLAAKVHPVADIEFPHKNPGAPPIKLRVDLPLEEVFRVTFSGKFDIPADAGTGNARVTLSFPAWKEGNVAPAIYELSIGE